MHIIKAILFCIFAIIGTIFLTIVFYIMINFTQEYLFVPTDYIIWIFNYPYSRLVFIYELYIILGFYLIINKDLLTSVLKWITKYRVLKISFFVILNTILLYAIIFSVSVIDENKIINYSFLTPYGKEYQYDDVVEIHTGVYGKGLYIPFTHSKGEFHYIITLSDGTEIDVTEMGGSQNEKDPRYIIEELDNKMVDMGITKRTSMKNFHYTTSHLAKEYTDKIKNILMNTN